MNRLQETSPELLQLLAAACADDATREQLDALEQRIGDDDAMQLLIDYMQLDGELHRLVRQRLNADKCLEMLGFADSQGQPPLGDCPDFCASKNGTVPFDAVETPLLAACSPAPAADGAIAGAWKYINAHEMLRGYIVAVPLLFLVLGMIWAFGLFSSPTRPVAVVAERQDADLRQKELSLLPPVADAAASHSIKPPAVIVGQISETIDCQWNLQRAGWRMASGGRKPPVDAPVERQVHEQGTNAPRSPLQVPLAFGDKLVLATGLMEITYNTGAKVILQGPCSFNIETNGGFLAVGKLTGQFEKGERGASAPCLKKDKVANNEKSLQANSERQQGAYAPRSPSSSPFVIATPTALVTDLGTEFGVDVDRNQATTINVIRGMVEATRDGNISGRPIHERLTAGQSLYIASLTDLPIRLDLSDRPRQQSLQKHVGGDTPVRLVLSPELKTSLKNIKAARDAKFIPKPIGIVATAYHRVWDKDGRLAAENDRKLAFQVATDDVFGRGVGREKPFSSFDTAIKGLGIGNWGLEKSGEGQGARDEAAKNRLTPASTPRDKLVDSGQWGVGSEKKKVDSGQWMVNSAKPQAVSNESTSHQPLTTTHSSNPQSPIPNPTLPTTHYPLSTAFVGLRYDRPIRFDRVKIFLARQEKTGGNWAETPRVFILKNPVDTDQTPPENDPGNWRELAAQSFYGDAYKANCEPSPGMVIEIPLTGSSSSDRTGYGWAIGGVKGNGVGGYVSVTELRAYSTMECKTHDNNSQKAISIVSKENQ
jgi:hypothetical protein